MAKSSGKVTIKKYANRRLYDTESSTYITLDRLAQMVREGREFEVVDAKSGEDITRQVLTQIIVDEEARGSTMLPINFLKQLIGLYGNSMQNFVPQYLEAAMDAFQRNQSAARDAFGSNVFADIAKQQHGDVRGCGARPSPASRRRRTSAQAAADEDVEQLARRACRACRPKSTSWAADHAFDDCRRSPPCCRRFRSRRAGRPAASSRPLITASPRRQPGRWTLCRDRQAAARRVSSMRSGTPQLTLTCTRVDAADQHRPAGGGRGAVP